MNDTSKNTKVVIITGNCEPQTGDYDMARMISDYSDRIRRQFELEFPGIDLTIEVRHGVGVGGGVYSDDIWIEQIGPTILDRLFDETNWAEFEA